MSSLSFERVSTRFISNTKSYESTFAFGFFSKLFLDKNSFLSRAQVPSIWSVDIVLTFLLTNDVLSAIVGPIYATIIYELLYIYEIFLFILPYLMRSVPLLVISRFTLQHLLHNTCSIQFIVSPETLILNSSIFKRYFIENSICNIFNFQLLLTCLSIFDNQRHKAFYRAFYRTIYRSRQITQVARIHVLHSYQHFHSHYTYFVQLLPN